MKRARMYATLALIAAGIAAFCFVPLPSHVYAPLEVQARGADSVYVGVDGVLEEVFVRPGDKVNAGDPLAQLENIDVDLALAELAGQRDVYETQIASLERISYEDPTASAQISQTAEMLESVNQQIAQREDDRANLRLVAPRAGTVLPPPRVPDKTGDDSQLASWSGSPMDKENLGATLTTGTKFCLVGDPKRLEARLVIDQGDIEFVAPGQSVEIMLAQSAADTYDGKIEQLSSENLKVSPTHLSSLTGGSLATQMDASGVPRPLSPVYEALVPLPDDDDGLMRLGLVGTAKISTKPRTLGERLLRYLSRTFNFEL